MKRKDTDDPDDDPGSGLNVSLGRTSRGTIAWDRMNLDKLPPCCSRSGVLRYKHSFDKDGVCIYCDKRNGHKYGQKESINVQKVNNGD